MFTLEKITNELADIRAAIHRATQPIPQFKFIEGDPSGAQHPDFNDSHWSDFRVGDYWGGYDIVAWFRTRVSIPFAWRDKKLALGFLVGPRDGGGSTAETMLYLNGKAVQAIDVWHPEAWLPPEDARQGEIAIALRAWSGVLSVPERRHFKLAQLIWIDEAAEQFYFRANTVLKAIQVLDENDLRRVRLTQALDESFHYLTLIKPRSPEFYESVADADQFLRAQLHALERDELKPRVVGIGHAHLDMAWLWRLKHTREKAARTFATVLHLMEQYPEYHFLHSSPQVYEYLEQDAPDLYARVKEKIAAGQWELARGMWIEADTNLTSGESLIRQILYGKRFLRAEFGVEPHVLWMPDVFGYSFALPQIMKKSGLDSFMTTKLSWNQFNRFPYDTFHWRGMDGTEVLAHFVTTPEKNSTRYTYIGQLEPFEVKGIWDAYKQKDINDELLLIYGWGDGGGGPTQEMLEQARVMKNLPGLPYVELGSAEAYFERLDQRVRDQDVPVWHGELYLEFHRGTYTSQAWIKRANRQAEILYHAAELFAALADILTAQNDYPASELEEGWKIILLNQFHDILPGSSIRQVYEDSCADHARIRGLGERALATAQTSLASHIRGDDAGIVVFNALNWTRDELIELPCSDELAGKTVVDARGAPSPVQLIENEGQKSILLRVSDVPALGYAAFALVLAAPAETFHNELMITPTRLENRFYSITLNAQGQITSLYDRLREREVLAPNARGNVLQAFEDKPGEFDAWDIEIYYREKEQDVNDLIEAVVEEQGPLRGVLRFRWQFYDSTITQRLTLYADSPRIDFRTVVDWHERQVLLKVAFPVAVSATRATSEIQFGSIERPTHWNTSWDYARFEWCHQRWVDLSEGGYGVALLNDCKYGCDVHDHVLRLTLIKSPIFPDETADLGTHWFTYSLLPHAGDWRAGVVPHAHALNDPLRAQWHSPTPNGTLPRRYEFARIDANHVIVETVKRAEDERAWIVRVYEYKQARGNVNLFFAQPIQRIVECNLIERDEKALTFDGTRVTFFIVPFEIKTFKVWFH